MTVLIEGGTVVTLGKENRIINPGGVVIEGNNVKEIAPIDELKLKYKKAEIIYAKRKVIMPSFINAHHHMYSTFARGMDVPGPTENFSQILENFWWKLDDALFREAIYYSSLVSLMESVRHGVTSVIDHHESQSYQIGSLDEITKAVEEVGLKAVLCLGTSDRCEKGQRGLEENERFLRKRNDKVKGVVGLHASFTVSEATLKRSAELSEEFKCGVHVHCCEAPNDEKITRKKYSKGAVERFQDAGILNDKTLLIHGVHLSEEEMDVISESGAAVIHNPESNMNNAVGYAKILDMIKKGIRVGLGTDGMSPDMLSQMRAAFLLARHEYKNAAVGFEEVPPILLNNNPRILNNVTGWDTGEISPGTPADIAVVDYDPATPINSENFTGHLLFAMTSSDIDTTICSGKTVMRHKKIISVDEAEILLKARETAKKLWEKIR